MRGTTFPWRGLGMTTTRSRGECDGTGLDVMGWMVVCRRSMIKYFWQRAVLGHRVCFCRRITDGEGGSK